MEIRCPGCSHPIIVPDEVSTGDEMQTVRVRSSVNCPNCGLVSLDSSSLATTIFQIGADDCENKQIAHFRLVRKLGGGGFGTVWLARDITLERQVALKLPISQEREADNLLHEAQTAASLRHPNIVSIYEVGSDNGRGYIASEYIDGLTLRDFLSTGRPSIAHTVEMLIAVAQALHHAHEQGVIHRDVKPANILLNQDGQPFVADFGLAKRISADATISSEGQVIGTARYMSPEQASGKTRETDHRADIYALGAILFEMLTGEGPFRGNVRAILHQKVFEDAPSPRKLDPTLPKDLETICLKCLERDPGKRYATAGDVADELRRFRAGEPIQARPITSLERAWRRCRRYPVVTMLLVSLFFSLTVGLLGVSFFGLEAKRNAELTQQSLYRSQMNLAAEYLESGDTAGVRRALERFGPGTPLAHLRGFAWRYFDHVTSSIDDVANLGDVVQDVAISRDGSLCASCGDERTIRVWDAKSGELIRTLSREAGRFRSLAFSPTSVHLAAGASDGMVYLWNPVKNDRPLQQLKHGPPVALVRYAPDGKSLLSAGQSGAVRVWNLASESLLAEIPAGPSGMIDARFSPDGEQIAIASRDGIVRVWKVRTRERLHALQPNPHIATLAYSDDGQTIVTGGSQGALHVWSATDGGLQYSRQMLSWVGDLEFLRQSRVLAIAASDGQLHLIDIDARRELTKVGTHNLSMGRMARSADGKWLVVGSGDGAIKRVRVQNLLQSSVFWHEENIRAVAFLPDSQRVVAGARDGSLRIWNVETGESQELSPEGGLPLTAISLQPGGKLMASGGAAPKVTVWDRDSLKVVAEIAVSDAGVAGVVFAPSGRWLALADRKGPILIYDRDRWTKPRATLDRGKAEIHAVAISPDDRVLAAALADGNVRLFDLLQGTEQGPAVRLKSVPTALCFCEDGRTLAISSDVGDIHLWDVKSRQTRLVIKAHSGRISALAAMPDGRTLVSAGRDRALKLSDTATGEAITSLIGHMRQIYCVTVSPDGATLASGGLEGDVRIWRTR